MSKKLSTKERALLATANPVATPSSLDPVADVIVEPTIDSMSRSPQRPRTALGISSAQFFKNDETTAENERLKRELQTWDGAHAAKKLDPKLIKPSKWANRHELSFNGPDFVELKKEIESAGGNVQPIKVRPIHASTPQSYEVVFGHRRHRACLELGIDVLAMIESIGDQELFMEMDRENRQRADLRPYEQGVMYAKALDDGLFSSNRKLADELNVDLSGVGKLVALARLPNDVLKAFESPLEIQFQWGSVLAAALKKDPDFVLARAREIAKSATRLKASAVFQALTTTGVDSVYPSAKPIILNGKAGSTAEVSFDPKKKTLGVNIAGVSVDRISELEQLVARFLNK